MHVCMCVSGHTRMWKPKVEALSPSDAKLTDMASLASQLPCLHLLRLEFQAGHHAYLLFVWTLEI